MELGLDNSSVPLDPFAGESGSGKFLSTSRGLDNGSPLGKVKVHSIQDSPSFSPTCPDGAAMLGFKAATSAYNLFVVATVAVMPHPLIWEQVTHVVIVGKVFGVGW